MVVKNKRKASQNRTIIGSTIAFVFIIFVIVCFVAISKASLRVANFSDQTFASIRKPRKVTPTPTPVTQPSSTPIPVTSAPTATPVPGSHLYGLIGQGGLGQPIDTTALQNEYNAGVRLRMLEIGWDVLQPNGTTDWNTSNASAFQQRIDAFTATGPDTKIVLDLGMQNPPAWVANTDPLVDQYGNVRQASSSNAGGVNVYWSPTVRQYVATYIQKVFTNLNFRGRLWAVRVGPYGGEMLYPCYASTTNCSTGAPDGGQSFWAFDTTAQAQSPVPGWKPGQPSPNGEASRFYNWYVDNLSNTFSFILNEVRHYYSGYVAPVTPGYGMIDSTASTLVSHNLVQSGTCCYGTGNYWQRLFNEFNHGDTTVINWSSSFGDGSGSNDSSPYLTDWSTAHLMSYYAQNNGRQIYGENPGENAYSTGQCNAAANTTMQWDFQAMQNFNYLGLVWVRETDFGNSCYASLSNLASQIAQYH